MGMSTYPFHGPAWENPDAATCRSRELDWYDTQGCFAHAAKFHILSSLVVFIFSQREQACCSFIQASQRGIYPAVLTTCNHVSGNAAESACICLDLSCTMALGVDSAHCMNSTLSAASEVYPDTFCSWSCRLHPWHRRVPSLMFP